MTQMLPNHKYKFNRELPFSDLEFFTNHRRLNLFIAKGHTCDECGIECNRLIQGEANDGKMHIDLYDAGLTRMLTVGHIIPKSKGGKWVLSNFRPLCHVCNSKEGTCIARLCANPDLFNLHLKGKKVRRHSKKPFANGNETATIDRVFLTQHPKKLSKNHYVFGFSDTLQTYPANKVHFIK